VSVRKTWLALTIMVTLSQGFALCEEPTEPFTVEARRSPWEPFTWFGVVNHSEVVRAVCVKGVSVTVLGVHALKSEAKLPASQSGGERCTSFDYWHLVGPGEHLYLLVAHAKPESYPANLTAEVTFKGGSETTFLGDAKEYTLATSLALSGKR
jgi:hypothetical protein